MKRSITLFICILVLMSCSLNKRFQIIHEEIADATTGTLSGVVINEDNERIQFVFVFLEEIELGVQTNESGEFKLTDIPPGTYTFKLGRGCYIPKEFRRVEIRAGNSKVLRPIIMKTASYMKTP